MKFLSGQSTQNKCPVCGGKGFVNYNLFDGYSTQEEVTTATESQYQRIPCVTCLGTGVYDPSLTSNTTENNTHTNENSGIIVQKLNKRDAVSVILKYDKTNYSESQIQEIVKLIHDLCDISCIAIPQDLNIRELSLDELIEYKCDIEDIIKENS